MTTTHGSAVQEWVKPLPVPSALTAPFWRAAAEGRFVMQRCTTCHAYVWTPQIACRNCLTETLEWAPLSGRGEIYTYVIMHRAATPAFQAPYAIVVVTLEEGPRILSDMIDVNVEDVHIGMPVEVAVEPVNEQIGFYHFRPRS